ncbi:probable tyrosine-protein kinase DDB_G0283397 [Triticum dicoccoides]|uniref:probable tyrosine-protein kinase DDB_G0283397 n=1 Tax=Triticum dicoccoides TaxID=85692 RepID=UPI00188F409A|nr:probable tyrosine-protein kinase DDB_G0283397 [Triticum dicoccoides]
MGDETALERILDGDEEPKDLPLALLQSITNDFSEDRKIGQGGFGEVYKGVLRNGFVVAVKRMYVNEHTVDDVSFRREVKSLMKINHQNVVRFLGFCSHAYHTSIKEAGSTDLTFVNVRERLLCLEYVSNGSLDKHITDELRGLEWETRYEIIIGICKGLCYLHEEKKIVHMDLKPANILIHGKHMVPKITDFGLSRPDENSHTMAQPIGTRGYIAPEYEKDSKTSAKSDIYSLGAIIFELVTGCMSAPNKNNVLRRWRHRWNKPPTLLQYQQVTSCIEIAVSCRHQESKDRPSICDIISFLSKSESTNVHSGQISPCFDEDDMLGIKPLELQLPSELKKEVSCSIELTNDTHNCIAFNIQLPSRQWYSTQPYKGIVQPESKYSMNITVQPRDFHEHDHANKFIVQSMKVSEGLRDDDFTERMFEEASEVVDEVNLMVAYKPTKPQENCKSKENTNMPAKEVPKVINSCLDFFSWVTPGIVAARHQLVDQDDTAAQQQIHEVREQLRQLDNDLWRLRTTMAPKMLDLIDRVEWQSHKKPTADLLPDIKDAVYDAEDLLVEFNYYAMKLRVEQSKNSGQDHMEGAFLQFYNSIKDCAHFSKVKEIQDKLDHIYKQSKDLGLHQAPQKFDRSIRPETCSFSDEPQIFDVNKNWSSWCKI